MHLRVSDRPEGVRRSAQSLIPLDRAGGSWVKVRRGFAKVRRERFAADIGRPRRAGSFVPRTKPLQRPTQPLPAGSTTGRCESSEFSLSSQLVLFLPGQLLGNVRVHHLLDPIFSAQLGHQRSSRPRCSDIGFVPAMSQEVLQIGLVWISPILV